MSRRRVSILLFDGFELLDAAGPLELLATAREYIDVELVGPHAAPVHSSQGTSLSVDRGRDNFEDPDVLLVPGGPGTRTLVHDSDFLRHLFQLGRSSNLTASVCTGAALLAAAGLLDGYRATSNKRAFAWVTAQGPRVDWQPVARWVEDRDRWTSSGVAAGMDMTDALIAQLHSPEVARWVTHVIELEVQSDPSRDPFAPLEGDPA